MEWIVTEECIGCESCVEVCPDVFAMDDATGLAVAKKPTANPPCAEEAKEICPVGAIERE